MPDEKDQLTQPAYEVLELPESRVAEIKHDDRLCGTTSVDSLLAVIDSQGQVDGILEAAQGLPYGDYLTVETAWKQAPKPRLPRTRRRR